MARHGGPVARAGEQGGGVTRKNLSAPACRWWSSVAAFYDSAEILDLLSLLQLLDNPLQDVPAIAVLRSPLVGLSLDELAEIRLAAKDVHFWTALNRARNAGRSECGAKRSKKSEFFSNASRAGGNWRGRRRCRSGLEDVLAETHYAEWLRSRPRGAQRQANVERLAQPGAAV